jgi:hypothetical protein
MPHEGHEKEGGLEYMFFDKVETVDYVVMPSYSIKAENKRKNPY